MPAPDQIRVEVVDPPAFRAAIAELARVDTAARRRFAATPASPAARMLLDVDPADTAIARRIAAWADPVRTAAERLAARLKAERPTLATRPRPRSGG